MTRARTLYDPLIFVPMRAMASEYGPPVTTGITYVY